MTKIKSLYISIVATLLSACGSTITYTLQDQVFDDEYYFREAVTEQNAKVRRAILPLPKPITTKKLIIVFPDAETIATANIQSEKKRLTRDPKSHEIDMFKTISWSTVENIRTMYDAAKTRGIYSHVALRESQTMTNSLAPAADYDTLVWYEEAKGLGQWFYSSSKYGKQVFAWDRSSKDIQINTESFLSALQALAIRE